MSRDEVFIIVKQSILKILPDINESEINILQSLKNLGANSIDRMDVTVECMKTLKIKVPLVRFGNITNIQELVEVLYVEAN